MLYSSTQKCILIRVICITSLNTILNCLYQFIWFMPLACSFRRFLKSGKSKYQSDVYALFNALYQLIRFIPYTCLVCDLSKSCNTERTKVNSVIARISDYIIGFDLLWTSQLEIFQSRAPKKLNFITKIAQWLYIKSVGTEC